MKRSIALRVLAVLLGVLAFSPARAIFHYEGTTYYFKNSQNGAIKSFHIEWDESGGMFKDPVSKALNGGKSFQKAFFPGWDYVGYEYSNRGDSKCVSGLDERPNDAAVTYGVGPNSFCETLTRQPDSHGREFSFEDLDAVGKAKSVLLAILYVIPGLAYGGFYAFFVCYFVSGFIVPRRIRNPIRHSLIAVIFTELALLGFVYSDGPDLFIGIILFAIFVGTYPAFITGFAKFFSATTHPISKSKWFGFGGLAFVGAIVGLVLICLARELNWTDMNGRVLISVIAVLLMYAIQSSFMPIERFGDVD